VAHVRKGDAAKWRATAANAVSQDEYCFGGAIRLAQADLSLPISVSAVYQDRFQLLDARAVIARNPANAWRLFGTDIDESARATLIRVVFPGSDFEAP